MPDLAAAFGYLGDEWGDAGNLLELLDARPTWHRDAACREHPDISFFPGPGVDVRPALEVCASCLVRDDCARWACAQGPTLAGIWGGLGPGRRQRLGHPGWRPDGIWDPAAVRAEQEQALDAYRTDGEQHAADWDPGPRLPPSTPPRRRPPEQCVGCGQTTRRGLTNELCALCWYTQRYPARSA